MRLGERKIARREFCNKCLAARHTHAPDGKCLAGNESRRDYFRPSGRYQHSFDWFGRDMNNEELGDLYNKSAATIRAYFRNPMIKGLPESEQVVAVRNLLEERKEGGQKKAFAVSVGPRRCIEDIPSPTEYERLLWAS